ncbi:MAG: hypothetical protein ACI4AD_03105 [Roseburia sp.]
MSLCGKVYGMPQGTPFRNVNGSTEDPTIGGMTWLDLWGVKTDESIDVACCACGENPASVGGHIVLGSGRSYGDAYRSAVCLRGTSRVFIAPICSICNGQKSGYFTAKYDVSILNLCRFMRNEKFNEQWFAAYFEGSEAQFRKAADEEERRYNEENNRILERYSGITLHDEQILRNSHPSIPSGPSKPLWCKEWIHTKDGRMKSVWK